MVVGAFMSPKTITFQLAFEVRNLIFHNDKGFTYIQKSIKVGNTVRNVSSKYKDRMSFRISIFNHIKWLCPSSLAK